MDGPFFLFPDSNSVDTVEDRAMTFDALGPAVIAKIEDPGFSAVSGVSQTCEDVIAVVFEFDHGLFEIAARDINHHKFISPLANRYLATPGA